MAEHAQWVCGIDLSRGMLHEAYRRAQTLGRRTSLPIVLQDERLTSVEAESRLASREKDWRARKARLDAAAAAIILQDYLDSRPHAAAAEAQHET